MMSFEVTITTQDWDFVVILESLMVISVLYSKGVKNANQINFWKNT